MQGKLIRNGNAALKFKDIPVGTHFIGSSEASLPSACPYLKLDCGSGWSYVTLKTYPASDFSGVYTLVTPFEITWRLL